MSARGHAVQILRERNVHVRLGSRPVFYIGNRGSALPAKVQRRDAPDAEPILSQEVAMSLRTSIRIVSTVIALATASMIASVALASHHFALAIDAAVQLGR